MSAGQEKAMTDTAVTLVRRILRYARGQGVRRAVLNLHHLPETITRLVGDGGDLTSVQHLDLLAMLRARQSQISGEKKAGNLESSPLFQLLPR